MAVVAISNKKQGLKENGRKFREETLLPLLVY
jgi:hypothetical protein